MMTTKPKISVIRPVYNVEEYIEIATFNNNEEIEPNFEALEGSIIWK